MNILHFFLAVVAVSFVAFPGLAAAASDSFQIDADALSGLRFSMPENPAAKAYLGLTGTGTFTMPQIRADMVIFEIFSMYCPVCQAEAPVVNTLHQLIQGTSSLKGKVKLIGIGAGNTPFEVEIFRKKYNVLFPMFPDEKLSIQKAISGPIRTPTFVAVKSYGGNRLKVQHSHVGGINPEQFLKEIVAASHRK